MVLLHIKYPLTANLAITVILDLLQLYWAVVLLQCECGNEITYFSQTQLFCLGRTGWPRSELVPMTNVRYKGLLWMWMLNTFTTTNCQPMREREMFYLMMHSTHFMYGYMASDIWLRTILIVRKETRCCHIGYSFRLAARVLLYAPSHRQDNTYHGLCYTSRGALAGTRNSSMGPPHEESIQRP